MLLVNSVHEGTQKEAYYAGTPSVFVVLQGCAVGCPWCDARHTWDVAPSSAVPAFEVMGKEGRSSTFAKIEDAELIARLDGFKARHIVITGGEPCLYDLTEFTRLILKSGRTVQVETSGTAPVRVSVGTWVTVSPKVGMPSEQAVLHSAIMRANEIKHPVGKEGDVVRLRELLLRCGSAKPKVWLQPINGATRAMAICEAKANEFGWEIAVRPVLAPVKQGA